jgi:hypothetical protein
VAGCARGRALGDGVCGRWAAATKVPSAYTRMTAYRGRIPRLRDWLLLMPAKIMHGGARRAFLIARRQILEINLTRSQQKRTHFLIATFSSVSALAPHLTNHASRIEPPFLFDTNKAHKIIILTRTLLKTKEKRFSIRYKLALGSIGLPPAEVNLACALRFWAGAVATPEFRSGWA